MEQSNSYRQEFAMVTPKLLSLSCTIDGKDFDPKKCGRHYVSARAVY